MRFKQFVLVLLLILAAPFAGPGAAVAQDDAAAAAMVKLASGKFPKIEEGVSELAASGHARALDILQALQAGTLAAAGDGTLYISAGGKTVNAANGEAVTEEPFGLKPIRLNNGVRRALDSALGNLTLLSKDPAKRKAAADAVFTAHDPAALPAL